MRRPRITQQRFAVIARSMFDDPDLTGDVLLFALALAEHLTRSDVGPPTTWAAEVTREVGRHPGWARYTIRQDLPRHDPVGAGDTCVGTMVRRPTPCGQPATQRHWLRDPLTGEVQVVGSCYRHHRELEQRQRVTMLAWVDAGKRPGPQNAGGILERYFTADWDRIYLWVNPSWVRPDSPAEPPRRPTLTLIHGGLEIDGETSESEFHA